MGLYKRGKRARTTMRGGVWNRSLRVSFREFRVTKLPSRGSWFNWDAFGLGGGISSSYLAWITGCEVLFSGSMRCTGWSNKVDDGFLHPTNANYSSSDNCVEEWRTRGSASLTQRCVKNCCSLFGRPLGGVNYCSKFSKSVSLHRPKPAD